MCSKIIKIVEVFFVIVSLPSTIIYLIVLIRGETTSSVAVIVFIFFVFVLIIIAIYEYLLRLPVWTILKYHKTVEIQSKDGTKAKITKKTYYRANHKGITEFVHSDIKADGQIKDFILNGKGPPKDCVKDECHKFKITERFKKLTERFSSKLNSLFFILHLLSYFNYIKVIIRTQYNEP